MKILLYCTKSKPYIYPKFWRLAEAGDKLNGKVVVECDDYEVEEIIYRETTKNNYSFGTKSISPDELLVNSCLTSFELCQYIGSNRNWVKGKYGKAIHIKNLKVFDKPKELKEFEKIVGINEFETERCDFCSKDSCENCRCNYQLVDLDKAPQNMMYVFDGEEKKVLISIRPEWLCKILNGEKTIEVRKKVLKDMLKNE